MLVIVYDNSIDHSGNEIASNSYDSNEVDGYIPVRVFYWLKTDGTRVHRDVHQVYPFLVGPHV